jgi:hypothetical protein
MCALIKNRLGRFAATFREHLASSREHLASFREHLAPCREHLTSFRKHSATTTPRRSGVEIELHSLYPKSSHGMYICSCTWHVHVKTEARTVHVQTAVWTKVLLERVCVTILL